MSDQCRLHEYICDLHVRTTHINTFGLTVMTSDYRTTINISINHPSLFTQRISYQQRIKPTNFVDHIDEKV